MIRGLIKEEEIDLHQHGSSESDSAKQKSEIYLRGSASENVPHLPSTRERVDSNVLSLVNESKVEQSRSNLFFVAFDSLLLEHETNDGDTTLVTFDIVFDVSGRDVLGEVVDLFSVDGFEKGRFSTSVGSTHSVSVTSSELESGVVEEEETSVGEREGKVANDLSLFVIFLLRFEFESRLGRQKVSESVTRENMIDLPCRWPSTWFEVR